MNYDKDIRDLYSKQVLKENISEASYEDIGGSLYTFLKQLRQKYPQEKETIDHWMLRIDEDVNQVNNIATADMNPEQAVEVLGNAVQTLSSLIKSA